MIDLKAMDGVILDSDSFVKSELLTVDAPETRTKGEGTDDHVSTRRATNNIALMFAYLLGDRLQSDAFMNAIFDSIRNSGAYGGPWGIAVRYAYEHTLEGSRLRSFLVDCKITNSDQSNSFLALNRVQHKEFILDVAKKLWHCDRGRMESTTNPTTMTKRTFCSKYHEHGDCVGDCVTALRDLTPVTNTTASNSEPDATRVRSALGSWASDPSRDDPMEIESTTANTSNTAVTAPRSGRGSVSRGVIARGRGRPISYTGRGSSRGSGRGISRGRGL